MSDQDVIRKAYSDQLTAVYRTLVEAFDDAEGDAAKEQKAKDLFKAGVVHARKMRDLALGLFP